MQNLRQNLTYFSRTGTCTHILLRRNELFYSIDELRLFHVHWQDASVHDQPGYVDELEQKPSSYNRSKGLYGHGYNKAKAFGPLSLLVVRHSSLGLYDVRPRITTPASPQKVDLHGFQPYRGSGMVKVC